MADITITVAVDVGQEWILTDTSDEVVRSNRGPAIVRNVPDGDYTIEWSTVQGYDPASPRAEEKTITGTGSFTSPVYAPSVTNVTAIWANDGADKVLQDDLRTLTGSVNNHAWDGSKVTISGARNEIVAFSLYLESEVADAVNIAVTFDQLDERGAGTDEIASASRTPAQLYQWAGSPIELFHVKYLPVQGLSGVSYDGAITGPSSGYDERHAPGGTSGNDGMRRPWELTLSPERGTPLAGFEAWGDRPGSDKYYPDILDPIEVLPVEGFTIAAGTVQQVWCDIYIPKGLTAGIYDGTVSITEDGGAPVTVDVELTVHDFDLADVPATPAMVHLSDFDINWRHYRQNRPTSNPESADTRDNYAKLLHRHKLSAMGDERGHLASWDFDDIPAWWTDRLTGDLFSDATNYDGPGKDTGNRLFSIGTYADWRYRVSADQTTGKPTQSELQTWLSDWNTVIGNYDTANPTQPVEFFAYLGDEPIRPKGEWNLAGIAGSTPAATDFSTDGATKDATRTFRIHRSAFGFYTTNAGLSIQGWPTGNRIILQRDDDPENQWAIYELTEAATGDGDVATLANCTHIESAGAASFGAGENWHISGGAKDVVFWFDVDRWARWAQSTGVKTFTTVPWDEGTLPWGVPNVDHIAHPVQFKHPANTVAGRDIINADPNRLSFMYNGRRPLTGSFATEDDGTALVTIPWAQYKLSVSWHFYWQSTYYFNYTSNQHQRVFENAHTFGTHTRFDPPKGKQGSKYSNGDGLLLYPGTDEEYPASSREIDGPIASIRLKMWRRGIQDVDYVVAAKAAQPGQAAAIDAIVDAAVPEVMWEYGVADEQDPGYQYTDISWSTDPDDWHAKRVALAGYAEAP